MMKIDYELVEKIGATHYAGEVLLSYYKLTEFDLLYFNDCNDEYETSNNSSSWVARNLKPIPPKRTRTEYERVTESIFDLRDEFERGELYCKHEHAREYSQITNTQTLAQALRGGFCYRKVEKEIDWREDVTAMVNDEYSFIFIDDNGIADALFSRSSKINFLELCRVTLRALGEL